MPVIVLGKLHALCSADFTLPMWHPRLDQQRAQKTEVRQCTDNYAHTTRCCASVHGWRRAQDGRATVSPTARAVQTHAQKVPVYSSLRPDARGQHSRTCRPGPSMAARRPLRLLLTC